MVEGIAFGDPMELMRYIEINNKLLFDSNVNDFENSIVSYKYQEKILNKFTEKNFFKFKDFKIRFEDRKSLWILIHELLVNQEYFFDSRKLSPTIIDCGVNFGLSLAYFKSIYPKSKIIGFEPLPKMFDTAQKNIIENKWQNIIIYPYALSSKKNEAEFIVPLADSMAGSLTRRRELTGEKVEKIKVKCVKLSSYLKQKVDFLKLDIEGSEEEVLTESREYLKNVKYIFCEYHFTPGENNFLDKILTILEEECFDFQVSKSWSYGLRTKNRPMLHVGRTYSAVIFAKNRRNMA